MSVECSDQQPKLWTYKDPYVHPTSEPDRYPWSILQKPILDRESDRVEAWREEVQNLLVFAGLFSAVATAFVIESYKTLQPSFNPTMQKRPR